MPSDCMNSVRAGDYPDLWMILVQTLIEPTVCSLLDKASRPVGSLLRAQNYCGPMIIAELP